MKKIFILIYTSIALTACGTLASGNSVESENLASVACFNYQDLNDEINLKLLKASEKTNFQDQAGDLFKTIQRSAAIFNLCWEKGNGKVSDRDLNNILLIWSKLAEFDQSYDIAEVNFKFLTKERERVEKNLNQLKWDKKISDKQSNFIMQGLIITLETTSRTQDPK